MRVSAAGFAAKSLEEAKVLSRKITEVTHDHPEGVKGAEAVVVAIYMAKTGSTLQEIRDVIDQDTIPWISPSMPFARPTNLTSPAKGASPKPDGLF